MKNFVSQQNRKTVLICFVGLIAFVSSSCIYHKDLLKGFGRDVDGNYFKINEKAFFQSAQQSPEHAQAALEGIAGLRNLFKPGSNTGGNYDGSLNYRKPLVLYRGDNQALAKKLSCNLNVVSKLVTFGADVTKGAIFYKLALTCPPAFTKKLIEKYPQLSKGIRGEFSQLSRGNAFYRIISAAKRKRGCSMRWLNLAFYMAYAGFHFGYFGANFRVNDRNLGIYHPEWDRKEFSPFLTNPYWKFPCHRKLDALTSILIRNYFKERKPSTIKNKCTYLEEAMDANRLYANTLRVMLKSGHFNYQMKCKEFRNRTAIDHYYYLENLSGLGCKRCTSVQHLGSDSCKHCRMRSSLKRIRRVLIAVKAIKGSIDNARLARCFRSSDYDSCKAILPKVEGKRKVSILRKMFLIMLDKCNKSQRIPQIWHCRRALKAAKLLNDNTARQSALAGLRKVHYHWCTRQLVMKKKPEIDAEFPNPNSCKWLVDNSTNPIEKKKYISLFKIANQQSRTALRFLAKSRAKERREVRRRFLEDQRKDREKRRKEEQDRIAERRRFLKEKARVARERSRSSQRALELYRQTTRGSFFNTVKAPQVSDFMPKNNPELSRNNSGAKRKKVRTKKRRSKSNGSANLTLSFSSTCTVHNSPSLGRWIPKTIMCKGACSNSACQSKINELLATGRKKRSTYRQQRFQDQANANQRDLRRRAKAADAKCQISKSQGCQCGQLRLCNCMNRPCVPDTPDRNRACKTICR